MSRAAGSFGDGGDHATAGALYADDVPAADHPWSSPEHRKPGWLHRALRVEYPGGGGGRRMLALCRKGGDLELFTLPELKRVFRCGGAHRGLSVLEDGGVAPEAEPAAAGSAYPQVYTHTHAIHHACMHPHHASCMLMHHASRIMHTHAQGKVTNTRNIESVFPASAVRRLLTH